MLDIYNLFFITQLERLKSGEDIMKEEDENVIKNTYNPEEKNIKKKREKVSKGQFELSFMALLFCF